MLTLRNYASGLRTLHSRASELPLSRLIFRILAWKAYRMVSGSPVIRIHERSRMRLDATDEKHGIRTGIFLFHEDYEPSVRVAIDRYVQSGSVCYDIGANLGLWSLRMAERAGANGQVFAFEPVPKTSRYLEENIALSATNNIEVLRFALGDKEGTTSIYIPDDDGRAALSPEDVSDTEISIKIRKLDDLWHEQGRPQVAFVKMDVEGAEPLVLRGGMEFFSEVRPITCCEINPGKLKYMGFSPADIFDVFGKLEYRPMVWRECRRELVPFDHQGGNDVQDLVLIPTGNG